MYKIFSVDDHLVEPAHLWVDRVPAKYSELAPHVVAEGGRELWAYEEQRTMTMGLNAVAGKPREEWGMEPVRFSDMLPGCYDPKERARDMLSQGVLASICFPTLPRFGGLLFAGFKDKVLADLCVKAWNDYVLDEWCPGGPPGLFVPMTICQMWDPESAAQEISRCAERGSRALCFPENPVPDGLPSFHDPAHWDPIWQACVETGLPVSMHIGSSGFIPIVDPAAEFMPVIAIGNVCGMLSMVNLLLSGVFDRFEDLKVVWSEAGIGWVPSVLERCDRQVERHQYWSGKAGALRPSEIFRRNMVACMVEEPLGLKLYDLIGADNIVAETDYPHADTPFPYVQKAYAEVFDGIPAEVVEKVSHGNAERIFNWTMAEASLATVDQPWLPPEGWGSRCFADAQGLVASGGDPTVCHTMVQRVALLEECGAPVIDGVCEAGHTVGAQR
jgi:predicted TIM-barrel fold metal-dependent hydrolase